MTVFLVEIHDFFYVLVDDGVAALDSSWDAASSLAKVHECLWLSRIVHLDALSVRGLRLQRLVHGRGGLLESTMHSVVELIVVARAFLGWR